MKTMIRRVIALTLALVLAASMCVSVSAFTYPKSYWKLQDAWIAAVEAQDAAETITAAQKIYDLLMPLGLGEDVCFNLEPKCARASWCCEMRGDIAGAITWLERQRVFAQWLDANVRSYQDSLFSIESRIAYLETAKDAEIYALTDQNGPDYTEVGAAASGTLYGSVVEGNRRDESAVLMYVTFGDKNSVDYWINYYRTTSQKFSDALRGGVIEFAWNFASENTAGAEMVLDPAYDNYIAKSLAALGKLDATILLRVGAEMNNWSECDPQTYIDAFRKIADAADRYSNIKMVFSPDNISNRNVTFSTFYPGDDYVDWIGMSTYHNTNFAGDVTSYDYNAELYGVDAYYGRGLYDNDPLVIIAPIVEFAVAHDKPVMVSECGFSYRGEASDADQTAFAADQLNKFYSYVNMIYPQVKAVFYFNITLKTGANAYALDKNATVATAYRTAIDENGAYLAAGEKEGKTWQPLSEVVLQGEDGKLRLATYAIFPAKTEAQVTYYVDGAKYFTSSTVPYYCDLDLTVLGDGVHTVRAEAAGGVFSSKSITYELSVSGGKASISSKAPANPTPVSPAPSTPQQPAAFTDVVEGNYFFEPVKWAVEKNITTGTSATTFSPKDTCTTAQILTFLWRAQGEPVVEIENPFSDVKESNYFYKAALWAYDKGLVEGDTFGGSTPCTRISTVTYFWKLSGKPAAERENPFTDVDDPAVTWAVEENITSGTSDTTFSPDATCTRGQIVTFLYRFAN